MGTSPYWGTFEGGQRGTEGRLEDVTMLWRYLSLLEHMKARCSEAFETFEYFSTVPLI